MTSHLIDLGQQALASVSSGIAGDAPIVKCKLLASEFYEALRQELKKPSNDHSARRGALVAAAEQCHQIAIGSVSPNAMLGELKRVVDLLNLESPAREPPSPPPKSRPVLRVIEGGLSKA
jgi:hypothetical protein